tara:strand:- start:446 stop:547 length:102 start_codon:yes stop_codon:yes gene_type:complete
MKKFYKVIDIPNLEIEDVLDVGDLIIDKSKDCV